MIAIDSSGEISDSTSALSVSARLLEGAAFSVSRLAWMAKESSLS